MAKVPFRGILGVKRKIDTTLFHSYYLNGFQNFTFRTKGGGPGVTYGSEWKFTYNNVSMDGGVKNIDLEYYFGGESDNNAFNLLKK